MFTADDPILEMLTGPAPVQSPPTTVLESSTVMLSAVFSRVTRANSTPMSYDTKPSPACGINSHLKPPFEGIQVLLICSLLITQFVYVSTAGWWETIEFTI